MKTTRLSFLFIFLIYVLAIFVGLFTFLYTEGIEDILRFLIADVAATLIIYVFSVILKMRVFTIRIGVLFLLFYFLVLHSFMNPLV